MLWYNAQNMERPNQRIIVRGCRIVSHGGPAFDKKSVLIRDGLIEDILPDDEVPADARVYDFPGQVISPCFCDYHLHFSAPAATSLSEIEGRLHAHGITKAYDGGDAAGIGLDVRNRLADTIEIVSSGKGLFKAGGYGKYIGQAVRDTEQAKSAIDSLLDAGADYIKIVQSGIYDSKTDSITAGGFDRRELRAMIGYAKDNGLAVFCHANGAAAVEEAVEEGASAIIHGLRVSDDTLSEMRDRNVLFIPTLQAFRSIRRLPGSHGAVKNLERAVDSHLAAVSRAYEKGVKVLPGSDAGPAFIPYGISFIEELRLMLQAGIPYEDVIRSSAAGPLERNVPADLLVLEGLELKGVFLRGKLLG